MELDGLDPNERTYMEMHHLALNRGAFKFSPSSPMTAPRRRKTHLANLDGTCAAMPSRKGCIESAQCETSCVEGKASRSEETALALEDGNREGACANE